MSASGFTMPLDRDALGQGLEVRDCQYSSHVFRTHPDWPFSLEAEGTCFARFRTSEAAIHALALSGYRVNEADGLWYADEAAPEGWDHVDTSIEAEAEHDAAVSFELAREAATRSKGETFAGGCKMKQRKLLDGLDCLPGQLDLF